MEMGLVLMKHKYVFQDGSQNQSYKLQLALGVRVETIEYLKSWY